ncbi:MAG: LEPR-XLL domain-containing protein, partial [Planctomycetes bacterium]|nr:LEPR-XLL domain-containing protein [Planctomycetota bacterium]
MRTRRPGLARAKRAPSQRRLSLEPLESRILLAADPIPLPLIGTAYQSSQLGGFAARFALDNVVNFTHTQANADLPGPAVWQVMLNETYQFETVTIWNRSASDGTINCCPQRLRDIEIEIVEGFSGNPAIDFSTAGGGSVTYVSALLNPENGLPGATVNPVNLMVDIVAATGGTKSGNLLRIKRFPDLDRSGNPGGNADDPTVLSLDLVEATGSLGLTVVHSNPAHGEVVAISPAFATIDFSAPVFVASLDAGDLTVDGTDSLGFEVVDVDTVQFELPPLASGEHTLAIAAGVIEAQQAGLPAIVAFSATFTIPEPASVANLPASDISAFAAQIGAELLDTGGDDPDVLLYWGDDDGGTNPAAWDNVIPVGSGGVGSYTAGIADLTHNTPYFYRAFATNLSGGAWAASTATFTTLLLGLPTIATDPVTSVGGFAADVSGTVTDTGGAV